MSVNLSLPTGAPIFTASCARAAAGASSTIKARTNNGRRMVEVSNRLGHGTREGDKIPRIEASCNRAVTVKKGQRHATARATLVCTRGHLQGLSQFLRSRAEG